VSRVPSRLGEAMGAAGSGGRGMAICGANWPDGLCCSAVIFSDPRPELNQTAAEALSHGAVQERCSSADSTAASANCSWQADGRSAAGGADGL
jgi:hypothetical protein